MCVLIGSLWPKYIMFELQKYRRVIFHNNEELCKFLRKTDLWFEKWHKKFGKFSPEHLKVSKLGLWWDPFVQSRKGMTLKFTEELCVTRINNHAKFEEKCAISESSRPFSILNGVYGKWCKLDFDLYGIHTKQ